MTTQDIIGSIIFIVLLGWFAIESTIQKKIEDERKANEDNSSNKR